MKIKVSDRKMICGLILFFMGTAGLAGQTPRAKNFVPNASYLATANQRLGEGDILMARKEHYPALMKYLEASRLNPDSEIIFNKLGIVYSQLALNKEAVQALNRAITINKRYSYAYNNLGSVYFATRELGKAEKNFKKAIRLNSRIASFHYNLGAVYFEKKKFKNGEQEYRKALELDRGIFSREDTINLKAPAESLKNPERFYYLARIYAFLNNVDKTIECLKSASDLHYKVVENVDKDVAFDTLRNDKRFVDFIEDLRLLKSVSQWN